MLSGFWYFMCNLMMCKVGAKDIYAKCRCRCVIDIIFGIFFFFFFYVAVWQFFWSFLQKVKEKEIIKKNKSKIKGKKIFHTKSNNEK